MFFRQLWCVRHLYSSFMNILFTAWNFYIKNISASEDQLIFMKLHSVQSFLQLWGIIRGSSPSHLSLTQEQSAVVRRVWVVLFLNYSVSISNSKFAEIWWEPSETTCMEPSPVSGMWSACPPPPPPFCHSCYTQEDIHIGLQRIRIIAEIGNLILRLAWIKLPYIWNKSTWGYIPCILFSAIQNKCLGKLPWNPYTV